jgi:hypothetical protein
VAAAGALWMCMGISKIGVDNASYNACTIRLPL